MAGVELPDLAKKEGKKGKGERERREEGNPAGYPVKFKFQINNKYLCKYTPIQYLGYTYLKQVFVVYLKFDLPGYPAF